jgi:hypothetical protein
MRAPARCRRWLGCNLRDFGGVEAAAQMAHRENGNSPRLNAIHDPEIPVKQLAHVRPLKLRDQTAPLRQPAERPGDREQPINPAAAGGSTILRDVGCCLGRPLHCQR